MKPESKVALIVGAGGVIGRNLIAYLSTLEDWKIVGLSRRPPDSDLATKAKFISVDLLDPNDCREKLKELSDTTHIFYAAYQERKTWAELVAPNKAMLVNIVEAIEPIAPGLQHMNLMTGYKTYGAHLGPFKTPAKESDPRHMPPEFYYDQEDFLKERQQRKSWTWSALRPSVMCGFAVGNPMNLTTVIAVYAAISKELGLPLRFPGKPGAYTKLLEVTDSTLLAKACVWAATDPKCGNQVFNIANGDLFRWQHLWPKFANFFGMDYASPQHISLTEFMADKEALWNEIVQKYGLKPYAYKDVAAWPFGDAVFIWDYDMFADTTKSRRFGFHEFIDSEEMFLQLFSEFRRNKIIP